MNDKEFVQVTVALMFIVLIALCLVGGGWHFLMGIGVIK